MYNVLCMYVCMHDVRVDRSTVARPHLPKRWTLSLYMYICLYVCICMYVCMMCTSTVQRLPRRISPKRYMPSLWCAFVCPIIKLCQFIRTLKYSACVYYRCIKQIIHTFKANHTHLFSVYYRFIRRIMHIYPCVTFMYTHTLRNAQLTWIIYHDMGAQCFTYPYITFMCIHTLRNARLTWIIYHDMTSRKMLNVSHIHT
jgi:hypothetical protein